MNDERQQLNEQNLQELVEQFARQWQQNRETTFPLPSEILFDLEGLPDNPSPELRRFQRELAKYDGGQWTRTGAINPILTPRLRRNTVDLYTVVQQ